MKVKDWNLFFNTIGKQLNFVLCLTILAIINFSLSSYLERLGFSPLISSIVKRIMIVLGVYYFIYSIILTKKIIDKYYK